MAPKKLRSRSLKLIHALKPRGRNNFSEGRQEDTHADAAAVSRNQRDENMSAAVKPQSAAGSGSVDWHAADSAAHASKAQLSKGAWLKHIAQKHGIGAITRGSANSAVFQPAGIRSQATAAAWRADNSPPQREHERHHLQDHASVSGSPQPSAMSVESVPTPPSPSVVQESLQQQRSLGGNSHIPYRPQGLTSVSPVGLRQRGRNAVKLPEINAQVPQHPSQDGTASPLTALSGSSFRSNHSMSGSDATAYTGLSQVPSLPLSSSSRRSRSGVGRFRDTSAVAQWSASYNSSPRSSGDGTSATTDCSTWRRSRRGRVSPRGSPRRLTQSSAVGYGARPRVPVAFGSGAARGLIKLGASKRRSVLQDTGLPPLQYLDEDGPGSGGRHTARRRVDRSHLVRAEFLPPALVLEPSKSILQPQHRPSPRLPPELPAAVVAESLRRKSPLSAALERATLRVTPSPKKRPPPVAPCLATPPPPKIMHDSAAASEARQATRGLVTAGDAAAAAPYAARLAAALAATSKKTAGDLREDICADVAPLVCALSAVAVSDQVEAAAAAAAATWVAGALVELHSEDDSRLQSVATAATLGLLGGDSADVSPSSGEYALTPSLDPVWEGEPGPSFTPGQVGFTPGGASDRRIRASYMGQSFEVKRTAPMQAVSALWSCHHPAAWTAAALLHTCLAATGSQVLRGAGGLHAVRPLMNLVHEGVRGSAAAAVAAAAAALSACCHCSDDFCTAVAGRPAYVAVLRRAVASEDVAVAEGAAGALAAAAAVRPMEILEGAAISIGSWHPAALVEERALPTALAEVVGSRLPSAGTRASAALALTHLVAADVPTCSHLAGDAAMVAALGRGLACDAAAYDAARILRYLAIAEPAGITDCLAEASEPLSRLLRFGPPRLQPVAAAVLAVVLEGRPEAAAAAARGGAVPAAVKLLKGSGSRAGAELLVALLCEAPREVTLRDGCAAVPPVVALLNHDSLPLRAAAACALQALAQLDGVAAVVMRAGAVQPLAAVAATGVPAVAAAAAAALCNLTAACPAAMQRNAGVVMGGLAAVMVESLHVNGHFSATAAVANLAAGGTQGRSLAATTGMASALLRLLDSSSWYVRIASADAIGRLAGDPSGRVALAAEAPHLSVALLRVLQLRHHSEAIGSLQEGGSRHLHFTRAGDNIRLDGFALACARTSAALALGALAFLPSCDMGATMCQVGGVLEVVELLASSSGAAQRTGALLAADLAASSPAAAAALQAAGASHRLGVIVRFTAGDRASVYSPAMTRKIMTASLSALAALSEAQPPGGEGVPKLPRDIQELAQRLSTVGPQPQRAAAARLAAALTDADAGGWGGGSSCSSSVVSSSMRSSASRLRPSSAASGRSPLRRKGGSGPSLCAAAVAAEEKDGEWRGFTTSATLSTHLLPLTQVPLEHLLTAHQPTRPTLPRQYATSSSTRSGGVPLSQFRRSLPQLPLSTGGALTPPLGGGSSLRSRFAASETLSLPTVTQRPTGGGVEERERGGWLSRGASSRQSLPAASSAASYSYSTPRQRIAALFDPRRTAASTAARVIIDGLPRTQT